MISCCRRHSGPVSERDVCHRKPWNCVTCMPKDTIHIGKDYADILCYWRKMCGYINFPCLHWQLLFYLLLRYKSYYRDYLCHGFLLASLLSPHPIHYIQRTQQRHRGGNQFVLQCAAIWTGVAANRTNIWDTATLANSGFKISGKISAITPQRWSWAKSLWF